MPRDRCSILFNQQSRWRSTSSGTAYANIIRSPSQLRNRPPRNVLVAQAVYVGSRAGRLSREADDAGVAKAVRLWVMWLRVRVAAGRLWYWGGGNSGEDIEREVT